MSSSISIYQTPAVLAQTERLLWSFEHWTGRSLLPGLEKISEKTPVMWAQALFNAQFVVVSHGVEADPIFNYANQTALDLWELDWSAFTQMPSRLSAEETFRADRAQMLAQIAEGGFFDGYSGIRISSQGRRFSIENVTIWKVIDPQGHSHGQAATFEQWVYL
ncbi:MAG: MEKHLA domain-containing protein [Alkalinema sp. RU_4_3]|nr:MEKHLA domain-containing protein [Alkalinema sp. RU_4_3]